MGRVILHCDLNNFYASVECLYNPEIREKPVAVCGSQSTRHGIVLAKNMYAKNCGVKAAEPVWQAKKKCPELVVVPPNYSLYLKFSNDVREILLRYTDLVEAFGIDESWMDVTESTKLFGDGLKIAESIKERIKSELGITASIGVSFNKIFAKLGSDIKKPDAITYISEENYKKVVWDLPVQELLYVGKSTLEKLNKFAIYTIGDLANSSPKFLSKQLGKWGETLWEFANGYDASPVVPAAFEPVIKGIGNSVTTPRDLTNNNDVKLLMYVLAESVARRLRAHNLKGRTIQVWVRAHDLETFEKQGPLQNYTYVSTEIAEKAYEIFTGFWKWEKNIRAVGIRVTNLAEADNNVQLSFLEDDTRQKKEIVEQCIDSIRKRFGYYSVQRAFLLTDSVLNTNIKNVNGFESASYFNLLR